MKDASKPNNKIANSYASYITDTLVGYFVGKPISYNGNDPDILNELQMIFEYNDEADENAELAKNASIYGIAYELLYMNDNVVRFKSLDPKECIPIFDDTLDNNLLAFIRYYDNYDVVQDKTITTNNLIEIIENNKWATEEEVMDYFAIGQCTPGIIAVNTATFIGFKTAGVIGGIVATLGLVFPSIIIISVIAAFIRNFTDIHFVQSALKGIQICVCALILDSVIKLGRKSIVDKYCLGVFLLSFVVAQFSGLSTIVVIIGAAVLGLIINIFRNKVEGRKS